MDNSLAGFCEITSKNGFYILFVSRVVEIIRQLFSVAADIFVFNDYRSVDLFIFHDLFYVCLLTSYGGRSTVV